MIRYRFNELLLEKQRRENQRITLLEVARETGINRNTLSKIADPRGRHVASTNTLEKLCAYFCCTLQELVEYIPDGAEDPERF